MSLLSLSEASIDSIQPRYDPLKIPTDAPRPFIQYRSVDAKQESTRIRNIACFIMSEFRSS